MIDIAQKRAQRNYQKRRVKRRVAQFEAASGPSRKGGILAALRRSPLVGADFNLAQSRDTGRKVDL